jgi:YD repeat-containing protein
MAAFCAFLCGHPSFAADKSGVSPNTISLPKGPGSIEGLGESFQPTLNTGTAKYGVRLSVPPGVAGQTPALALHYEGGGGNGPLGFGWSLSQSAIQRRCDKGIPTYGEDLGVPRQDSFINDSREELVPTADGFYFCKNEGAFVRYRQVNGHWEATLPDGTRQEFGLTESGQIHDGTNRIFSWLLERETDTRGNTVLYGYTNFPGDANLRQKYLASIRYGPGGPPWANYHFVAFQYEERPDWFEDCRPGFPVRTGQRLKAIIVGTHGPALSGHAQEDFDGDGLTDNLVRRYDLDYAAYAGTNSHWSLLGSVRVVGADGVATLPPSTFGYVVSNPPDSLSAAGREILSLREPSQLMDSTNVDLVDLNADGLPDILRTIPGGNPQQAYLNLGPTDAGSSTFLQWTNSGQMTGDTRAASYTLSQSYVHLADLDGDGLADLVSQPTASTIYFFQNLGNRSWGNRRTFLYQDQPPPSPYGNADVRTADLDFDKQTDIFQSPDAYRYFVWFRLGTNQYSSRKSQTNALGAVFSSPTVQIADLNGDRVPDVAQIRQDSVVVTAGLGYGRFAAPVAMGLQEFLTVGQAEKAKLQDINGDGLADLVIERAAGNELWYWLNLGNYHFSARKTINGLPSVSAGAVVRWADLNGNGSTDLVYAGGTATTNRLKVVDLGLLLNGAATPNVLTSISNGIGRVTLIGYEASTKFALEDAAASQPWPDPMPFPVQVVASVTNLDSLGHQYVSQFRYHDGYYDPVEKQFRGFARVEQMDLGDVSAPTLVTRSHFDTGRDFEVMKGRLLRLTAEQEDGLAFTDESSSWTVPPLTLYTGTNGVVVHYAHPLGRTNLVKELGQGTERRLESEMDFDKYGNQTRQAEYGIVEAGNRSAANDERITTTEYAINTNAWILRTPARQETKDENGTVISRTEFFYDDETFAGNNGGLVTIGNLTMRREWKDPANAGAFIQSTRTKYDSHGNPTTILDPLANAASAAAGHAREIAYDTRFHTFPVTETIHLGSGKAPLVFQASYDEAFGTVTSSTDFNANTTTYGYDTFARLTSIVKPGDTPAYPTVEYDYALAVPFAATGLVNFIETRQRDKSEVRIPKSEMYLRSRQFVDGLGRKLLTKQEAEPAPGSTAPRVVVTEASPFNARQKPVRVLNPFFSLLGGSLDDQLGFESIEAPGWTGSFALTNSLVTLDLASAHATHTDYDATLRPTQVTNPDGTQRRTVYEPLLTRSFDENDTDPASPYHDTPMVHYNDGLGRLIQVDETSRLNDDGTPVGALRTWTTRYILLSNRENLDEKGAATLKELLRLNSRLNKAYVLKEEFERLWAYRTEAGARKFFDKWKASLKWQRLEPLEKFAGLVERHWDGIVCGSAITEGIPMGFVEGINCKIRAIQKRAYGLSDEEYLKLKILTCTLPKI